MTILGNMSPAQRAEFAAAVGVANASLGVGGVDATLTRIKASIQRVANPGAVRRHQSKAWNPAPAWAAGAVWNGQRVTNAGGVYVCIKHGTSQTAPAGAGMALIADNDVTWQYIGPSYTADADAPTYVTSSAAPTNKPRFYRSAGSGYNPANATKIISSDAWYDRWGSLPQPGQGHEIVGYFWQMNHGGYSFMTDAKEITLVQNQGTGNWLPTIEVDGRYLVDGCIPFPGTSGDCFTTITFKDRRLRKIGMRAPSAATGICLIGCYVPMDTKCFKPAQAPADPLGFMVLDSFGIGTELYGGDCPDQGIAARLFGAMGIDRYYADAQGGTGFVGGGEYNYNRADRIALLSTTKPDVVVALLSVNDDGASQTDLTAAVTTWVANVRQAAGANAWIAVIGETGKQNVETESPTEGYVRLALAAINDPKLIFIPATGDPAGAWMNGNGSAASPNGSGNADIYYPDGGIHPSARGQAYIGDRAGRAVAEALMAR